jgi:hypothetical protein
MKEGLTKEIFFNQLANDYPKGMKTFCDWIDSYKKKVKWYHVFGTERHKYIKYHDLPWAFQVGIYIQFIQERGGCHYEIDLFKFDLVTEFTSTIKMLDEEID